MLIRPATAYDLPFCSDLVMRNWGWSAADRHDRQMEAYLNDPKGEFSPRFFVATLDNGGGPLGFAAYEGSMLMKGAYNFIWVAVHDQYKIGGVGTALTQHRIDDIKQREGQMIQLVTQKPDYFSRFGFFKLHHIGNDWYIMLKLLVPKVDI